MKCTKAVCLRKKQQLIQCDVFEGLGTQLVTATEGRVDEIVADVMLLTVNDVYVCLSLLVTVFP